MQPLGEKDYIMDERTLLTKREVQLRLLSIWSDVEYIFRQEGVRYFLSFGSLLGAVRHQGFIPWDDDLDIHIHQDDYQKALVALTACLPPYLKVITHAPGMEWEIDFRVMDKHTQLEDIRTSTKTHVGLFIDFFSADRCHPKMGYLHGLCKQWKHLHQRTPNNLKTWQRWIYPLLLLCLVVLRTMPGKTHWFVNDKVESTTFCPNTLWPLQSALFEGRVYSVPADADRLLQAWYGDYMTPLPVSKQSGHFTACYATDSSVKKVFS